MLVCIFVAPIWLPLLDLNLTTRSQARSQLAMQVAPFPRFARRGGFGIKSNRESKTKTEPVWTPFPFWLPLLGSNHATLFRYAQRRVCSANIAQRNRLRKHDILTVQAKQRKEKEKQTAIAICFSLAPPAGLEPATS